MNIQAFTTLHSTVANALAEHRLLDALRKIEELAHLANQGQKVDDIRLLRQDYAMLLNYMKSGMPDIERDSYFNDFLRKAYHMTDMLRREYFLEHTDLHAARVWRRLHQSPEAVAEAYVPFVEGHDGRPATLAEILADPLASYAQLFDTVWTSAQWSDAERELVYAYVMSNDAPYVNRMTLVNAVGIALLFCFDEQKYLLLLSVIEEHQVEVSVRALVMSVFAYIVYRDRIPLYSSITLKFDFLGELTHFHPLVVEVQKALLVADESPNLSKEFEEHLPEKMLAAHEQMKEMPEGLPSEAIHEYIESHPQLRKFRKAMLDAVHEFVEMQEKGVDLNYNSFSHIKDLTPYFEEASNWFCPFADDHPLLFNISSTVRFLGGITSSKSCDTDRFAIVFSMTSHIADIHIVKKDAITLEETTIEEEDMDDFIKEISKQIDLDEVEQDHSLLNLSPRRLRSHVVRSVQDAHRFFTLFSTEELPNPFDSNIYLWHDRFFRSIFRNSETTRDLANWLFELENFMEAIPLYNNLPFDADIHERLGFAYEQMNNNTAAQRHYLEALHLNPDDEWTTLQLVRNYRHCGNLEGAAGLLEKLVNNNPDDERLARQYGEVLLALFKFVPAQSIYSKLYYLHSDHLPTRRAFAWCLLGLGEYSRAAQIYDDILATDKAKVEDYVNAGHSALLQHDIPSAVVYYQESLRLQGAEYAPDNFFAPDAHFLRERGIDRTTQQLLIDLLNI